MWGGPITNPQDGDDDGGGDFFCGSGVVAIRGGLRPPCVTATPESDPEAETHLRLTLSDLGYRFE